MEFDPETRLFQVVFQPRSVTPEAVFAAVWQAGRQMGREYLPRLVSREP